MTPYRKRHFSSASARECRLKYVIGNIFATGAGSIRCPFFKKNAPYVLSINSSYLCYPRPNWNNGRFSR